MRQSMSRLKALLAKHRAEKQRAGSALAAGCDAWTKQREEVETLALKTSALRGLTLKGAATRSGMNLRTLKRQLDYRRFCDGLLRHGMQLESAAEARYQQLETVLEAHRREALKASRRVEIVSEKAASLKSLTALMPENLEEDENAELRSIWKNNPGRRYAD